MASTSTPVVAASGTVRPPSVLLREVADFARSVSASGAVTPRSPTWVTPPTQAELAWALDRSTPLNTRMEALRALMDACRETVRALGVSSVAALHWVPSLVRLSGTLVVLMLDEFLPTIPPDDPSYATRMDGLRRMGNGTLEMVGGALTITAGGGDDALRLALVEAVRDHVATFARLWSPYDRSGVAATLRSVRASERDSNVAAALDDASAALARAGAGAP